MIDDKLTQITTSGQDPGRADLRIRCAGPDDVAAIVALVESAYRGEASRVGWTTEADLLDGQRTDASEVAALVAGGADGRAVILVAENRAGLGEARAGGGEHGRGEPDRVTEPSAAAGAGSIVACCAVEGDGTADAHFGMFAVRPRSQGGGIGRRLVGAAERHALEHLGATTMRMHVIRQREELIAWYRRLGYEPTGETAPFPYGDERFGQPRRDDLEFIVLQRELASSPG
jgi:ribosomal protein S18 acetylase RimI-like enzyme